MNLSEFQVTKLQQRVTIDFNNENLMVLEEFLNGDLQTILAIDFYLDRCYFVRDHWNTLELTNYINNNLGGFWEDEYLQDENLTGQWFSIINKEVINGGIHVDDESFHLENELGNHPTVSMSFIEFIDILEQWRTVLNEYNFV